MVKFNNSGGIGVMGYISPMDTRDTYAVIDPLYGIDGLRNVDTIDDLINISEDRRRPGMIVGVGGGDTYYKLKNLNDWLFDISDWLEIDLTKITYVDKETPSGMVDGINNLFVLNYTPIPGSEHIFLNGLLQDEDEDYIINYDTIIFNEAPLVGMKIRCSYRK